MLTDKPLLEYTFLHIPRIGGAKELAFWKQGIFTWDDYELKRRKQLDLFEDIQHDNPVRDAIRQSKSALALSNTDFFAQRLPNNEHFRIVLSFPQETMFLDIESTGLSKYYDNITIIGWSLGEHYDYFIRGRNSSKFIKAVKKAKAVITFNGIIFDIPFILKEFPNLKIPLANVDLRFFARKDNFSGGQKLIEEDIGFERPPELKNIKGETAPLLWYKYRLGERESLEKLFYYNYLDIEGMKYIFDKIAQQLVIRNQFPVNPEKLPKFYKSSYKTFNEFKSTILKSHRLPKYKGKPGPKIYLEDLASFYKERKLKIVGIDLTGSEVRPSGWCFLDHDIAHTEMIYTNKELIEKTISLKPDLVSIDSPLSLPLGRINVYDDDPGRDEFGIMRIAERRLKQRGVNVYPSLIPSMQKLTERGIKLAANFRKLGFPVIESYPGAAQDIIDIPRKREGLEYLQKGLEKFGVKGKYLKTAVTHDELDAITSAIVGHFFWSGKFEALGDDEEEFLIIPDLNIDNSFWLNRKVIGLSGPIYSGKTTAGRYLEKTSYSYGRYSLILEMMLREGNIKVSRASLQKIGREMNKQQRNLCKKLYKTFAGKAKIVIDGLRFPEDHSFWIEKYGPAFCHIFIEADEKIREERYRTVGHTKPEFIKASTHKVEKKVTELKPLADYTVKNEKEKKSLYTKLKYRINKHFH
jgi:uncharacterized protein YprB with RNaseH-like and TPR domain/predicted nuclease with RNAse H fold/cytidylate kinase